MARFHHEMLRALRLDLAMSQDEAAHALGVDVRTYRRYESGAVNEGGSFAIRTAARRRLLRRMCDEFGVENEGAWLSQEAPLAPEEATKAPEEARQQAPAPGEANKPPGHKPRLPAPRRSHALQRAARFVGREAALAALGQWRSGEISAQVFAVVGVGGAGKTALVERFLAKDGPGAWAHSFYDDPRTEAVVELLSSSSPGPSLVVLDGLEAIQSEGDEGRAFGELEDPALRQQLRAAAAGQGSVRILVTSRFPLTDLAAWEGSGLCTLALAPLSKEETEGLLRAWGLSGDAQALGPLYERTGGHALSVAMLGSYVSAFLGGDPAQADQVTTQEAKADDPTARRLATVLGAYGRALAPAERGLLARLSLFSGSADLPLLTRITGYSSSTTLKTVARLERLGLLAKTASGVSAHPFVREHFKTLLDGPPEEAHASLRDAIGASLSGKPASQVKDPALLARYEMLLEHTRRSGRQEEAWGIYQRALGGFENLGLRLGAMTLGARVLAGFLVKSGQAMESFGGELAARLHYDHALYAIALGDLAAARRDLDAYLSFAHDLPPLLAISFATTGHRTRAFSWWLSGDFPGARADLDASLALAREAGSSFHLVRAHSLYTLVEHDQGDQEATDHHLAAAREIEPAPSARRAFWEAEILLSRGATEAARGLLLQAIAEMEQRGWVGHVAHGTSLLGLSWVDASPARARECLALALDWAHRSHEVEMVLRCHHLAARIAEATGQKDESTRENALGLALATTHQFRAFTRRFAPAS